MRPFQIGGRRDLGRTQLKRLYLEVARRSFRRYATYRGATLAGLFTNTVFGFIRAYILIAVFSAHPRIGRFDSRDAMTYVFLTQALIAIVQLWGWNEIEMRVRSGEISLDLLKPYSFIGYWLAHDYGRAVFHAIARGVVPMLIGSIFFEFRWPSLVGWMAFAVSVVLAVLISFAMRAMVNLSSFWLLDTRGLVVLTSVVTMFFSGFILPLEIYPKALQTFARALPFAAVINTPVEIFLEKYHGVQLAQAIGVQAMWGIVLLMFAFAVFSAGSRKLVIQGG